MSSEFGVPPNPAELAQLATIRRRRRNLWIVFLSYLPGTAIVGGALNSLLGSDKPVVVVAVSWMAAFMVAGYGVGISRCPRCGDEFHRRGLWTNTFAQRCMNCELPIRPSRPAA